MMNFHSNLSSKTVLVVSDIGPASVKGRMVRRLEYDSAGGGKMCVQWTFQVPIRLEKEQSTWLISKVQ
jgi:hypothetical protein